MLVADVVAVDDGVLVWVLDWVLVCVDDQLVVAVVV